MNINYELLKEDYTSKSITVEGEFIRIIGLDGTVTKINIKYVPEKYILPEDINQIEGENK